MKRTILAVVSDLHGGHRHGLLNPATILNEYDEEGNILDDYSPPLNPIQSYLWKIYQSQISAIGKVARGDDVILCLNGDMTAGNVVLRWCQSTATICNTNILANSILIVRRFG